MANKYNSKIVLANGEVLLDLTQDGVKREHVENGIWFHDKTGERMQGTNTKTVDASNVTAEAVDVLDTKTFGKGNSVDTGTLPNKYGTNVVITNREGTAIPWGAYNQSSKVVLSDDDYRNLVPANIKEGVTILGVDGEFGADDISAASKEVTATFEEQTFNPADDGVTFYSSVKVNPITVTRTDNVFGGVTVTIGG